MKAVSMAPLEKFIDINPESISKKYNHDVIEYIDISAVSSGYLIEEPQNTTLASAPSRARRIVRENDTILATVRPNLRSFLFIKEPKSNTIVSTGFAVLRAKDNVYPRYVYYAVTDQRFTGYLSNNVKGTSYPAVDTDIILRGEIPDLGYDEQKRIADILSAYDDLIGNNRWRIALLEQSARLLYKEWFVHLRFPGHEHVKITNGVPEGWETPHLSDLCHVGRGASPRPINAYLDGETPWFKIGDATASESPFILETKECVTDDGVRKSIKLSPASLILSNSATCGIPYFTGVDGCVHDGWLYFDQFERIHKFFLYCFLFFKQRELTQSVGDGSTQKNLNTIVVGRLRVPLPKQNSLLELFNDIAEPLFSMIFSLAKENMTLQKARDLLLPRLMSGEVVV